METGNIRNIRLQPLALGIYGIAVAAIAVLSIILFQPEGGWGIFRRGELFWWHLAWLEGIFTFLWFDGFFMPSQHLRENRKFIGSGYLAASSRVVATTVISLVIFAVSVLLPDTGTLRILTIFAQVFVLLAFGVSMVIIIGGQRMQTDGLEAIAPGVAAPGDLALELEFCAATPGMSNADSERLRRLKERMKYSLSGTGRISRSPAYPVLVEMVESLARDIRGGQFDNLGNRLIQLDNQITRVQASCRG